MAIGVHLRRPRSVAVGACPAIILPESIKFLVVAKVSKKTLVSLLAKIDTQRSFQTSDNFTGVCLLIFIWLSAPRPSQDIRAAADEAGIAQADASTTTAARPYVIA